MFGLEVGPAIDREYRRTMNVLAISVALSLGALAPVDQNVQAALAATGGPGAAVAIVQSGRIVYDRGFGRRSLDGPRVTAATRFEIGSLTKQFTAVAVLQLRARHKLSLNDPISRFLPAFPHARDITVLELLQQTTGLPDFMAMNHFVRLSQTSAGGFDRIARLASGPLHFAPGSKWEYSNTNYIVLGRLVEVVSHEPYVTYVKAHILEPAQMSETSTVSSETSTAQMATGYWRGLAGKGPLTPAPRVRESWSWSAGDLISTARDIARWYLALSSGDVISAADFRLMTTPPRLSSGKQSNYAFHWWTDAIHGHPMFSGLGDTFGFSSCIDVFPRQRLAVITLENVAIKPNGDSDAAADISASVFTALIHSSHRM